MNLSFLLLLSIATSIDALAVGISYGLLDVAVATPAVIIGVVTFALSLVRVYLGDRMGHLFVRRIEAISVIIIIAIGLLAVLVMFGGRSALAGVHLLRPQTTTLRFKIKNRDKEIETPD